MGCNTYLYTARRRGRSFVPAKGRDILPIVRLRGCVAIELFVGAIAAAAVSGAAIWGVGELKGVLVGETGARKIAEAAELAPAVGAGAVPESSPTAPDGTDARIVPASVSGGALPADSVAVEAPPWSGQFLGQRDEALLAPLRESPLQAVKLNRGGSSLSLRLDFESGSRAACKPVQIHLHSQPRREIAAYRLNRLLGLGSVPPAVGRRFQLAEIADSFRADKARDRARFMAEAVPERDGTVMGEMSWWVPDLAPATIEGFEIDATEGVVTWKRYLTVGTEIAPESLPLVAQVSDLVLFDFIINNSDRWSGGNIKSSQKGRTLVFLDNTLSFGGDPNGHNRVRTYLFRSQKFSRRLIGRLRQLDQDELEEALTTDIDPFPHLLERNEIRAILKRRDYAIRYVDELVQQHGEDAVLAFP